MSIESLARSTPRQTRRIVERCIRSGVVPYITSSPGMGKSSIVKQIAEDYGLILIDHRLSTSAPEDLSGLPRFRDDGRAEFAPFADLFPLEGDEVPEGYNGWLLLLDEFPSASKSVQAAAYKLVLDRMTGQKKLHPNVAIVCAGNLQSDRAIVNPIGTALQSRMVHIEMMVDFDEWLEDVAIPEKWDDRLIAFLSANRTYLMDFDPNHENKTFCCPRTWGFVNSLLKTGYKGPIPAEDTPMYGGAITTGVATSFVQFTAVYKEMVSLKDILHDPMEAKLPTKPDLCWATITSLCTQIDKGNYVEIFKYISRFKEVTFKILFYRTVIKTLPEIDDTQEYRDAAIQLGKYIHS